MKNLYVLFPFLFLFSCTGKTAISYNDTIIKPQLEIVTEMDSLFTETISFEDLVKHREKMVSIAEKGLEETQDLEAFKENISFKKAALDYFGFVKNYFGKTPNIDSILYKFNSNERLGTISDELYNSTQKSFQEYLKLENKLLEEQQNFAKEFQMKLDSFDLKTP